VADCRWVAEHLLAEGRTAPGQVFISGASAGGYTALRAVSEDGPFTAGVARSAIIDARRWTTTAPRFRRAHAAALAHDEAVVRPAAIRRPVLLIHGAHDLVAPIGEAIALVTALRARGAQARLVTLDEVGHEMSVPDQTETALNAELDLYHAILADNRA
jgi:dipeptidyl aminopeptidase/acylaminoacyl peptidase